jgi:hypothetical protein
MKKVEFVTLNPNNNEKTIDYTTYINENVEMQLTATKEEGMLF